jgi:hypothetical protein
MPQIDVSRLADMEDHRCGQRADRGIVCSSAVSATREKSFSTASIHPTLALTSYTPYAIGPAQFGSMKSTLDRLVDAARPLERSIVRYRGFSCGATAWADWHDGAHRDVHTRNARRRDRLARHCKDAAPLRRRASSEQGTECRVIPALLGPCATVDNAVSGQLLPAGADLAALSLEPTKSCSSSSQAEPHN